MFHTRFDSHQRNILILIYFAPKPFSPPIAFLKAMDPSLDFIQTHFRDYYRQAQLDMPPRFGKREWGFFHFNGKGMQRPVTFSTSSEARTFLSGGLHSEGWQGGRGGRVPMHAYHSAAYYEDPALPMAQKVWLGSDLVFDLDADHLKDADTMTFQEQLAQVKVEFIKLLDDFLFSDFGFDEEDVAITFSGGRGYHAHVRKQSIYGLSSPERREIVDYIIGPRVEREGDLDAWMDYVFTSEAYAVVGTGAYARAKMRHSMPKPDDRGWKGRMGRWLYVFVDRLEKMEDKVAVKHLQNIAGIGATSAKKIHQDLFAERGDGRGVDKLRRDQNIDVFSNDDAMRKFIKALTLEASVNVAGETDEPVTSDIKRLIRMATSLHGKSGLRVVPMNRSQLDDFEPLRDAFPSTYTDDPVDISVTKGCDYKLKNDVFQLKEGHTQVPDWAAVFLLCRREATLVP